MSVCVLVLVSTNTYLFAAKGSELIALNSQLFVVFVFVSGGLFLAA